MGIVFEIQPQEEIHERAHEIANSLSRLPLASLALTKKIFNASLDCSLDAILEMEATGQGVARSTEFHLNSAERFRQKLPLAFEGLA